MKGEEEADAHAGQPSAKRGRRPKGSNTPKLPSTPTSQRERKETTPAKSTAGRKRPLALGESSKDLLSPSVKESQRSAEGRSAKADPSVGTPRVEAEARSRFVCNHDGCGKGYASVDAVRKHCRQRHLEWLQALGQGHSSLYCSKR